MKMPPKHTLRFNKFCLADLRTDETVIAIETSVEERGVMEAWKELQKSDPGRLILLRDTGPDRVAVLNNGKHQSILLTDTEHINSLAKSNEILLDITTLPHHIWAPIFQAYLKEGKQIRVLYVEPNDYKTHPTPSSANLFDLSISFGGLSPLPGFAKLTAPSDDEPVLLVAFLGFEGT